MEDSINVGKLIIATEHNARIKVESDFAAYQKQVKKVERKVFWSNFWTDIKYIGSAFAVGYLVGKL